MVVIPELGNTISMIVQQVPVAVKAVQKWLTDLPDSYPALAPAVAELNIDWSSLADSIVTFCVYFPNQNIPYTFYKYGVVLSI